MGIQNEARGKLTEALNVLTDRFSQTTDATEQATITDAINQLNNIRARINQADLQDAANAIQRATISLERVVNSARLGPFDDFVKAIEGVITRTHQLLRNGELSEPSPRAIDPPATPPPASPESTSSTTTNPPSRPSQPTPPPPAPPSSPSTPEIPATVLTIDTSKDFTVLRLEYQRFFETMAIKAEQQSKVDWHIKQLLKNQSRYESVSSSVNNVPWAMVGIIHAMECGFNFACHLHNGDPLTRQTTHVPAGQPRNGTPPFPWETSAADALKLDGLASVTDWSIPHMLYLLEKFNGFGYRNKRLPTPYLWSFSNHYEQGKYVADGQFDPQAVSLQCGAAVMIKALLEKGVALS